jgi:magnesium transporter
MSSPPGDGLSLSSSPTSIRGGSPVRRRESTSQTDLSVTRLRHSPTVARSYDPNDPEVRERQRTMDVDMAMQLSRARRETVSVAPGVSPYETPPVHTQTEPQFTPLSLREQHDLDIARGERLHHADHDDVDVTMLHPHESHPIDLRLPHVSQAHDPALVVGPPDHLIDACDPSASLSGLPRYQPEVSSNFNFGPMEVFAIEEKALLGISSPTETFPGNNFRRRDTGGVKADLLSGPSLASNVSSAGPSDVSVTYPRSTRHRKLSQSTSIPRHHRKGIGGKMALFEGNAGAPPPTLPGRLMGQGNAVPSTDGMGAIVDGYGGTSAVLSAPDIRPGDTGGMPSGIGGIISTGHDRPYRFSFYSNALSATIHARSISELPAEGQSFEDLFNGSPGHSGQTTATAGNTKNPPTTVSTPVPIRPDTINRVGQDGPNGQGYGTKNNNNNSTSYFNRDFKNIAGDHSKNGNGNSLVGSGGDFEGNTWWLDVQCPTDEEMKMLSKVECFDFVHIITHC